MIERGPFIKISFLTNDITQESQSDFQLLYVMDGKMKVRVNSRDTFLKIDDIYIINTNTIFSLQKEKDALVAIFTISAVELLNLTHDSSIYFATHDNKNVIKNDKQLIYLLKKMLMYHMQSDTLGILHEINSSCEILLHLLKHYAIMWKDNESNQEFKANNRINQITEYIKKNYNKEISLEDLSKNMYLSVSYLSKYIKKKLGKGFKDYVNEIRLIHAHSDLINTDRSITLIAMENGFPNVTSFCKAFRRVYNTTPTKYRLMIKKKGISQKQQNQAHELIKLQKYFIDNPLEVKIDKCELSFQVLTDITKRKYFHKNWSIIFNLGPAGELLKSDIQKHIIFLKKKS